MTAKLRNSQVPLNIDALVKAFRLGREGQANEQLTPLIDDLSKLIPNASQDGLLQLNPLLAEALNAITRKDYLWAADLFEYEIAPLIAPLIKDQSEASETSLDIIEENGGKQLKLKIKNKCYHLKDHWFWKEFCAGWELETFELYQHFLPQIQKYVDIGSWIGPTLIYAHLAGATIAHAVEANPKSAEMLVENCQLNSSLKKMVHSVDNLCITDSNKTVSFGTLDGSMVTSSASSIKGHGFTVQGIRLLDYLKKIKALKDAFIKIDIEGAELSIVKDLIELSKMHLGLVIFLSLHPPFWSDQDMVKSLLAALSEFRLYTVKMTPLNSSQLKEMCLTKEKNPEWGTAFGNFFEILLLPKGRCQFDHILNAETETNPSYQR